MTRHRLMMAAAALMVAMGTQSQAERVAIEWVTVGDAGNAADTEGIDDGANAYGAVAYEYRIGKYEVTNSQYCQFLNAVAASDPNGLYNPDMGSSTHGGITRSGSPGAYTYAVKAGRGANPVNYVSWYDCLRFANWLHNDQPTGAQSPTTTEDGAYDMSLGANVVRKLGSLVGLPSEN